MFEKEAKEGAKEFTDNKERQVAYECGFLDGADKAKEELKEKLAGAERTRDNLRQLGFPTFQSCKEYADKMNYAKAIIEELIDLGKIWLSEEDDDYSFIIEAEEFLKEK